MKLIKMLGLAAVAAVAAMAFLGAASASADTLCKANEEPCSAANSYAIGTTITGLTTAAKPATLLGINGSGETIVEEECHSTASGKTTKNDGSHTQLLGLLDTLTFTSCKGICSGASSLRTPYAIEASGLKQELIAKTDGSGAPGAKLTGCFGIATCEYEATGGTALLTFTGGSPGHLTASKVPLTRTSGALCPAKGEWDALYEITSPNPAFLSALP